MKLIRVVILLGLCLGVVSCVVPLKAPVYDAKLFTVNNEEILVRNLRIWEKNYQIESKTFHPRWRQSLELINLDFDEVASAEKVDEEITRVRFRDGREDDFAEFFEDYIKTGFLHFFLGLALGLAAFIKAYRRATTKRGKG